METISLIAQIIIALGIYNVWLIRFSKTTRWRGGTANNMKQEFEVYGLPFFAVYIIGFLKLTFATMLLAGIAFPFLVEPAALGMTLLMLGAVAMHIKVGDPAKRSLPAFILLVLSLIVLIY